MPEKLDGGFRLQAALDAVERQRRDTLGELGFRDARLHTERLDQHVSRGTGRFGDVVEAQVVEGVETPGFHRSPPWRTNFCSA